MTILTFNDFHLFGNDRIWVLNQLSTEDKIKLFTEGIKELENSCLFNRCLIIK